MTHEKPEESVNLGWRTVRWILSIVLGAVGIIWWAAIWYSGVNDHLERIDQHLQYEDTQRTTETNSIDKINQRLEWLILHSSDAKDAPEAWIKPQSLKAPVVRVAERMETSQTPELPQ